MDKFLCFKIYFFLQHQKQLKLVSLIPTIQEKPQNTILMDILRFKYAQIFQKYIEHFISPKVSFYFR